MPLLLLEDTDRQLRPHVLCCYCREPVRRASEGVTLLLLNASGRPKTGQPFYLHKRCELPFSRGRGGHWRPLPLFCFLKSVSRIAGYSESEPLPQEAARVVE